MFMLKDGVELGGLHAQLHMAIFEAERLWKEFGQDLVITSTTEGDHGHHSLHYGGYAIDLRSRDFAPELAAEVAFQLQRRLSKLDSRFDVVLEPTHIHVELDILKRSFYT